MTQFGGRAIYAKTYWSILFCNGEGFHMSSFGLPLIYGTEDIAEAELVRFTKENERLSKNAPPRWEKRLNTLEVVEVFVTVIEKPKKD